MIVQPHVAHITYVVHGLKSPPHCMHGVNHMYWVHAAQKVVVAARLPLYAEDRRSCEGLVISTLVLNASGSFLATACSCKCLEHTYKRAILDKTVNLGVCRKYIYGFPFKLSGLFLYRYANLKQIVALGLR